MNNSELLYTIALTQMRGIGLMTAKKLCEQAGGISLLFDAHKNLRDIIPDASDQLVALMADTTPALQRAEQELEFMEGKQMRGITFKDDDYPSRLLPCDDSPLVLFSCGNADLNRKRIVSIVGTRHCTAYGKDICNHFVEDLHTLDPDILIVSGLAYGIDICAHKAALQYGMQTVGVMAHGLDMVYPRLHRNTAVEMTRNGGLLTEYTTKTTPEKGNFVQRNRIVAGIADVTVVVESAERGGSLITANLAHSYGREVCAFPGRVTDEYSKGCNRIIYNEMAHSIRSAQDLFDIMNWETGSQGYRPLQQDLFVELTAEERKVVDCLADEEGKPAGQIVADTGLSFSAVSIILFELESKGLIDFVGGGCYRLIRKL